MNNFFDYLTGLYNRQGMVDLWTNELKDSIYVQIMFIDLDNFKTVNDIYGHKAGDTTLSMVSDILKSSAPANGKVIRLGGDEFIMMIPGEASKEELSRIATDTMTRLKENPTSFPALDIISMSIGIVRNGLYSEGLEHLLTYSDSAMYFAKESGKNKYVFFEDFEYQIRQEREMEATAPTAFLNGRFSVIYYPIVHLQNGRLMRTVAKTIWDNGNGFSWSRYDFAKTLEKSGLIDQIDLFTYKKICEDFKLLDAHDSGETVIGIRVSHILLEDNIAEQLFSIASEWNVPPRRIEFMIDEQMFSGRSAERITSSLLKLHDCGFKLSVMNFGSDFSSVGYLNRIPFDSLFFDGDFIESNYTTSSGNDLLKTFFMMAKNMHILSVGQCVESNAKADSLILNYCDAASGMLFSKALPVDEYASYLSGIVEKEVLYSFEFNNNLDTSTGEHSGEIVGTGINYIKGISGQRGAIRFLGGPAEKNLIRLPRSMFNGQSFTVTMWLRPLAIQWWTSAFYMRMKTGFVSFMPTVTGNLCMFRMHTDGEENWTDVMSAAIPLNKWSYVGLVYDSFFHTAKLFIDGEFVAMHSNIEDLGEVSTVYIGGDSYKESYAGDMSSLHIYDRAKSNDEIKESYLAYRQEQDFRGDEEKEEIHEYPVHDPAIYEDPDTGRFYLYCTGAQGLVSDDLEHWESLGTVVEGVSEDSRKWTSSDAIWAPDIVKVGDEYRLYCSNSSWGVQQSAIFLATSDKAAGPFIPRQAVIKTDDTLSVNGIDANIIEDHESGQQYMLYGSFWGGVHLLPLDRETGLAADGGDDGSGVGSLKFDPEYHEGDHIEDMPLEVKRRRMGICLARRPQWTSGSIEGPYMIYHPKTGYYYLFVSYGSLKADYNIRIGRSKSITGPFLDYFGHDLADADDNDCSRGLMISAGYRWLSGTPYMGPGHNSVLLRQNGDMYLVSHIRHMQFESEDPGPGLLQIRRLHVTPDGWIIAGSQPYSTDSDPSAEISDQDICGLYERIELRPSIPQGICHAHPLRLFEDGRLECCSVVGTWKRTDSHSLLLSYGPITEYIHMEFGMDANSQNPTLLLSGLTDRGICTWATKH